MNFTYVLLLTYFLHNGPMLSNGIVTHSESDCVLAAPLIKELETKRKTINLGTKSYKIEFVDAQCVKIPSGTI